jgi:hypothetical protein
VPVIWANPLELVVVFRNPFAEYVPPVLFFPPESVAVADGAVPILGLETLALAFCDCIAASGRVDDDDEVVFEEAACPVSSE